MPTGPESGRQRNAPLRSGTRQQSRSHNDNWRVQTNDHAATERGRVPPALPPDDRVLSRRRDVGDRIRAARLHRNLTQEELALDAGLSRHGLNRIEQGHSSVLLDTLVRIADALDVPLAELVRE